MEENKRAFLAWSWDDVGQQCSSTPHEIVVEGELTPEKLVRAFDLAVQGGEDLFEYNRLKLTDVSDDVYVVTGLFGRDQPFVMICREA